MLEAAVVGVDVVEMKVRRLWGRLARRGDGVKGNLGFARKSGNGPPAVAHEMVGVMTPASAAPIEALST